MSKPRRDMMDPLEIESHHTWSRCVRRAFLMGKDPLTGQDFTHRRAQLYQLHEYLGSVLMIDHSSAHVLSNHLHNNLRSRPDLVRRLSDEEVLWRTRKAWPRYHGDGHGWDYHPTDKEMDRLMLRARNEEGYMERVRRNLSNISFFQARLKETIARRANREEKKRKTGHFWDGRFGNRKNDTPEEGVVSQLYCDLQQSKAGIITSLDQADFSTIQAQIRARAKQAFIDTHHRAPSTTDEDLEELEQLEVLFAGSWFSPLDLNAPLMTEKDDNPPPSEFVWPTGYSYQTKGPVDHEDESEACDNEVCDDSEACDGSEDAASEGSDEGPSSENAKGVKAKKPKKAKKEEARSTKDVQATKDQ